MGDSTRSSTTTPRVLEGLEQDVEEVETTVFSGAAVAPERI
jgi:hypothetical protein